MIMMPWLRTTSGHPPPQRHSEHIAQYPLRSLTWCTCCRRYPFLLVDRVVEFEAGKTATGYKNVSSNEQYFNGHFPSRAIMPGMSSPSQPWHVHHFDL